MEEALGNDAEALAEAAFSTVVPALALKQGFAILSRLPLRATGHLRTLGQQLAEVLKAKGDLDFILQLLDTLPEQSVGLADLAAEMTRYALNRLKETASDDGNSIVEIARLTNNLAIMLSELGQREEALEAAQEAMDLYRELTRQRPDTFTPDLARCLDVLGRILQADEPETAKACFAEGIETLTPAYLRYPRGLARLMGRLAKEYLAAVERMDETPDEALLGPVVEVFAQLQKP